MLTLYEKIECSLIDSTYRNTSMKPPRNPSRNIPSNAFRNVPGRYPRNAHMNALRNAPKNVHRNNPKKTSSNATRNAPKNSLRNAPKNAHKNTPRKDPMNTHRKGPRNHTRNYPRNAAHVHTTENYKYVQRKKAAEYHTLQWNQSDTHKGFMFNSCMKCAIGERKIYYSGAGICQREARKSSHLHSFNVVYSSGYILQSPSNKNLRWTLSPLFTK